MGIKSIVTKVGQKAADKTAKLSSLSPNQLQKVQEDREKYLSQKPDPNDSTAEEYTRKLLAAGSVEIYNAYLARLKDLYVPVVRQAEYGSEFDVSRNIRYFNITKWVIDKEENSLEKLVNVYDVLSNENCNISLVFHRTIDTTNVYLAVTNTENANNNVESENYRARLADAIRGNFPGSEWKDDRCSGILPCLKNDLSYSVAAASNVPTEKSKEFISQTIEKLIDGIVPDRKSKEYILILLATPVRDIESRKLSLAELYSGLAPYASWQTTYTYNEQSSIGASATVGVNVGASAGSQQGQNVSTSESRGTTNSASVSVGIPKIPVSATLSHAVTNSVAKTVGSLTSFNTGGNFGANFARSSNVTATIGKNEGIHQNFTNYNIKHALELLESQMKRMEQSTALGMWDFAAYVLSEDQNVASNVAHSYIALTQGVESYMSQTAINLWRGDMGEDSGDAKEICAYLRELRHPIFALNPRVVASDSDYFVYPAAVTATTSLSGKELAYSLNFPRKSIPGLPVIECAEFGRNITTYDILSERQENIELGRIFHMHHEENVPVNLNTNSLASHVFITGSTGSGKSNTIYQLLSEARNQGIRFMVIEPAKGEYKQVFGADEDVVVYGTNPVLSPLLRINPFSFPKGIHILEHLDRLVEIFNVCWPMYAAMPAVLKNAIEKSYEDCGWNLSRSQNKYGEELYPSFSDVARNIKEIIDTSEYDNENKGAYKGSLLTRLQSLTNGINGMIFTCDDIAMGDLFDQNVIVDLSRVGSSETKSLIMGMLVLKLQEYRISCADGMNSELKHITVLEEAHNLLKRTSTEQISESANLLGKSVEMLSNAIAEMRTYGEGFLIADQAPGLLDLSVIRNTNTKIIMRLPDLGDRELVGRSANLTEEQITELAKLPCGVAAVYQNEWVQPVLCKVFRYSCDTAEFRFDPADNEQYMDIEAEHVSEALLDCIMKYELCRDGSRRKILELKKLVVRSRLDTVVKRDFLEYLAANEAEVHEALNRLLYDFFAAGEAIRSARTCGEIHEWVRTVVENLNPTVKDYSRNQINRVMEYIVEEQCSRDAVYENVFRSLSDIIRSEGDVF